MEGSFNSSCAMVVGGCLFAALLTACETQGRRVDSRGPTISQTGAMGVVDGRPRFADPITLDGSSTILIPFVMESSKGPFDDEDPYTRGGEPLASRARSSEVASSGYFDSLAPYPNFRSVRWHNAVCKDTMSNVEWTILSERGVIGAWYRFANAMMFIAVLDDTNNDGKLNDLDARVAIFTERDGRNPRIVTPRNAQVWSLSFDSTADRFNFIIAEDTNKDRRFTKLDVSSPWSLARTSNTEAVPLISSETREKVQSLLK